MLNDFHWLSELSNKSKGLLTRDNLAQMKVTESLKDYLILNKVKVSNSDKSEIRFILQ